jgi:multisubunit Na+/H+ antiporter MnhG subunit
LTAQHIAAAVLLGVTVCCCWVGALGMWRMREPVQALHYLAVPGSVGGVAMAAAVLLQTGLRQTALKALLIAVVLLSINSVVSHATARAFRLRRSGHRDDDDLLGFDEIPVQGKTR